ncbi:MAG: DNA primase [Mariprofundales bacterium]|nr:DNA primase [Mariprofundales bacterium]
MAFFEQPFIESVLNRTDLVEMVSRQVHLKRVGANMVGLCPFHHEKTPSFSVSPDKQMFYCFGCGKGGNAFRFAMENDGYSFPEAVEVLAGRAGMELPERAQEKPGERDRRQRRLAMLQQAVALFQQALRDHAPARAYLEYRALSPSTIARYALGYAPDGFGFFREQLAGSGDTQRLLVDVGLISDASHGGGDRFRDRVIFPIRDRRGQVVGFGGRVLGEGGPKYLNSSETSLFHKSSLLYGYSEHRESIRKERRLIVVEGYMDVLALANHGLTQGVAPLGTAIGEQQLRDILRLHSAPLFCFDGDDAGRKAAWRALERMLPLINAEHAPSFLFLPQGEDPDSLLQHEGAEGLLKRIGSESLSALQSWIAGLRQEAGSGAEARARMAKHAHEMLATMADRYLAQAWQQEAEQAAGISISPHRGRNGVPNRGASGRKHRSPKYRVAEQFIKGLLQNPDRILHLEGSDGALFLDNDTLQSLYTRAFSIRGHYQNAPAGIIRELGAAFPESVALSRWAMVPEQDPDAGDATVEARSSTVTEVINDVTYQAILATLRMEQIQRHLRSGSLSLDESIVLQQKLRQLSQQRKTEQK